MKIFEEILLKSKPSWLFNIAGFTAPILFVFSSTFLPSSNVFSQSLNSVNTDEFLAPVVKKVPTQGMFEFEFSAYDLRLTEPLNDLGRQLQETGDHSNAVHVFKRALHVTRVNHGLVSEAQIPLLERLISSDFALRNWEEVNKHYSYMEHLYRKLYAIDDARLEEGLQKVSTWHVKALNVNLDGNRTQHLQDALRIFGLRLEVAKLTLTADDPKFDFLHENIEICEYRLYLASDIRKEMLRQQRKARRYTALANSD